MMNQALFTGTKNTAARLTTVLFASIALSACGGGSSSSGNSGSTANQLSNFQAADTVIGQANFVDSNANQGGSLAANTLSAPTAIALYEKQLFINEYGNSRIAGFSALPNQNDMTADFVLGQPDFTSASTGTSQKALNKPADIAIGADHLAVADKENNRVLLYNTPPTSGPTSPDVVIGQADFTSDSASCTRATLDQPQAVAITPDGKLIVADNKNNRVLIWNNLPTSNGEDADLVLGQDNFTECDPNGPSGTAASGTFYGPAGVWSDDDRLIITDASNNRALIWNSFPTSNFPPADVVLGQGDFTHTAKNDANQDGSSGQPSSSTLSRPTGVDFNGTQLTISDGRNHRVLIWEGLPTANFEPANVVLGQGDFSHNTRNDDDQDGSIDPAASARTLYYPAGVRFFDEGLLVTDEVNHRVLIYRLQ